MQHHFPFIHELHTIRVCPRNGVHQFSTINTRVHLNLFSRVPRCLSIMATFHRFGELPFELQEEIWVLAVRPIRRGVHWFEIRTDNDNGALSAPTDISMEPWREFERLRLVASTHEQTSLASETKLEPEVSTKTADVRTHRNPSIYNIDGGLWSACKHSRLVIERHSRNLEKYFFGSKRGVGGANKDLDAGECLAYGGWKAIATSYFINNNLGPQYFTVIPHADLFCFPLSSIKTFDWKWFKFDLPFSSIKFNFTGVFHTTFVYQPEWENK